jgi:hypothetical protein
MNNTTERPYPEADRYRHTLEWAAGTIGMLFLGIVLISIGWTMRGVFCMILSPAPAHYAYQIWT